jgi:polysaccharide lyase-like protein
MRTSTTLGLKLTLRFASCALVACGSGTTTVGSSETQSSATSSTPSTTGLGTTSSSSTGTPIGAGATSSSSMTATGASTSSSASPSTGSGSTTSTGTPPSDAGENSDAGGNTAPPDSGSASGDGGTAGCPAGAIFCDGFEGSTTLDSNWTVVSTPGSTNTTTVVTTKAHTGTNSVHISFANGSSGYTFINETKGFPITTAIWGRVWLNVTTTPGAHEIYIQTSDGMSIGNNGIRALNTYNGPDIRTNIDPVGTSETNGISNPAVALPMGTWTCFEWTVGLTGTMGTVSLYMNATGTTTAALVPGTTATFPSTGNVAIPAMIEQQVGYERYGSGAAADIYIDDYAIGTTQLGCD